MKETGVQAGRFHPTTAIYAVPRSFSRPILARTYSVEVTSFLSNLPHHRSCPLNRDSSMIHQHPRVCQGVFSKNFARFHGVSCGCFGDVGNVTFCADRKSPKNRWGPPSMSAYAERALIGVGPQDPVYGGRPPVSRAISSGGHRRRKVRSIPDAQVWASVMPLPCSSSPHQTRFAGLWRGPRLSFCAVRAPPALSKLWQPGSCRCICPTTAAPNR